MSEARPAAVSRNRFPAWLLVVGGLGLTAVGVALGMGLQSRRGGAETAGVEMPTGASVALLPAATEEPTTVRFSPERQASAGVKTDEVRRVDVVETVAVTGKLAVNDDRLAHIYSMVDGVLREANVRLGQDVKAGEVLATVDSKEVGQAKLDLARSRLMLSFAQTNQQRASLIHDNTQALIAALQKQPAVAELEKQFRDQPLGENRQLLVSSYVRFLQTSADYQRLKTLHEQNVGIEKDFIRAKAEYESASATYQALLEQLKFTIKQHLLEADQKLQEALTQERMNRAALLILGFSEKEIDALKPLDEGEAVAHYPIRAPFAGTIIHKHAVLSEHVDQQHQLYEMTDLSQVWIHADVFEKDLAALSQMTGKRITFRASGYPGREFTGEIIHMGDNVDERTRAVTLIAKADNADGLLKPGMFAEVLLPVGRTTQAIQVPAGAVQRLNDETFVFTARNGDEFERRTVRVGRTTAGQIEITSGLDVGERIVVEGAFALKSELLRDRLAD